MFGASGQKPAQTNFEPFFAVDYMDLHILKGSKLVCAGFWPANAMHPILPLHVEVAWANQSLTTWDSQDGANYHYEFTMVFRG